MQATVFTFDAAARTGSVVTDSGQTVPFDAAAFAAGGLRLLRPGQRIRADLSPAGAIVALTILTMDDQSVTPENDEGPGRQA